jgi:hypothetical protein
MMNIKFKEVLKSKEIITILNIIMHIIYVKIRKILNLHWYLRTVLNHKKNPLVSEFFFFSLSLLLFHT